MGWFNKKQGAPLPAAQPKPGSLPELPKLPELPDLPEIKTQKKEPVPQLPSFPNSSIGKKFSQNTIKDAVKGKEPVAQEMHVPEGRKGGGFSQADDFAESIMQTMPKKPKKQKFRKPVATKEVEEEFDFPSTEEIEEPEEEFDMEDLELEPQKTPDFDFEPSSAEGYAKPGAMKKEPVFIRIDKFEEALKTFEKTKKEIAEIEKVLTDIAQVREDEDKELENWQNDLVKIKDQVAKVDQDIFSRIE